MITFQCACGKRLKARDEAAGKRVRCPNCKRVMIVPTPEGQEDLVPCRIVPEPQAEAAAQGGETIDLEEGPQGAEEQTENAGATKRCPTCHVTLPEAAVLCTTCGYDFRTGKTFQPPKTLLQRIPWKAVRKAGASLAGLAIVVAVGLWAINKVQRTQEEQEKKTEEAEGKSGKTGKAEPGAVPLRQGAPILVQADVVRPRLELAKDFTFRYRKGQYTPGQVLGVFRRELLHEAQGKLRADGHKVLNSSEEAPKGAECLTLRVTARLDWSFQRVAGRLVPKEPYVSSAAAQLLRRKVIIWSPREPYTVPRPGVTEFTQAELADVPKLQAAKANVRLGKAANDAAVAVVSNILEELPTPDRLRSLLERQRPLQEEAQAVIAELDEKGITPKVREMVEKGNPYLIAALDERLDKIEDQDLLEAMAKAATNPAIAARARKALAKLAQAPPPEPKGKTSKAPPEPKKEPSRKRASPPKRPRDPTRQLLQLAGSKAGEEGFPAGTAPLVEAAAEESPYVAFAFARAALELDAAASKDAYRGILAKLEPRLTPDGRKLSEAQTKALIQVMEKAPRKPLARAAMHALVLGGNEQAQDKAADYLAKVAGGRAPEDLEGTAQKGIADAPMAILRALASRNAGPASDIATALLLRAAPDQRRDLQALISLPPAENGDRLKPLRELIAEREPKELRNELLRAVARRTSLRPMMDDLAAAAAREEDPKLQAVLLYALASNAQLPTPYLWRLLDLVKHPDREVRREAADRLRRLGKLAAPALEELKAAAEAAETPSIKAVLKGAVRRAGGQ